MTHTTIPQILKHTCTAVVASFLLFSLTGCNTVESTNYETVKMPPAMHYYASNNSIKTASIKTSVSNSTAPANSISPAANYKANMKLSRATLSRVQIITELRDSGVYVMPVVNDHKYVVPHHNWFASDFTNYFSWYLYFLGAKYNAEGMDCDNFANFYHQNMVLANLKAGGSKHGDVPCATIVVNQRDKGIYHALNLVRTHRGWYVVEPQDGDIVALAHYRYRDDITKVVF